MRVLVLNGSPKGKNSITLQTVLYLQKCFPGVIFEILHAGQRIRRYERDMSEFAEAAGRADLILFCYPVYTFLAPSQLHRFIELIRESRVDLKGKYVTQITTSKHFYDITAHRYIEDNARDLGMKVIRGLSADMEDLLTKKGQREARDFFRFVCWNMKWEAGINAAPERKSSAQKDIRLVIVADMDPGEPGRACAEKTRAGISGGDAADPENSRPELREMVDYFRKISACRCDVVNIREFPFSGGCLGCFRCASDGKCVYRDGFDDYLRNHIQTADGIVYAFAVRDHSMGSRFKMYDDRQFCNGHRTVTMGKPVGYLVEGCLAQETNLRMLMESRSQVGGNFLAGCAASDTPDGADAYREIRKLADTMEYAVRHHYRQPADFYGVGGMKIFRDLIYQMQGLMREDHRFYKEHGFYDFPQKHMGRIWAMYLVGAMASSPALSKKLGNKMTEGMLLPYRKVTGKDPGHS